MILEEIKEEECFLDKFNILNDNDAKSCIDSNIEIDHKILLRLYFPI